jgi:hypothetical protein
VLTDPSELQLDQGDATELADAIAPLLAELGLTLQVPHADRWYLGAPGALPDWQTHGWRMAAGRATDLYSPRGADARQWRRLVNEVQMTWFEHAVNQRRAQRGLQAVNSLWLDGRVPTRATPGFDRVVTDDPAIAGLARLAGATLVLPLSDAGQLGRGPDASRHHTLVVSDAWHQSEREPGPESWRAAWQQFTLLLTRLGAAAGRPPGFERLRIVLCGDRRWIELRARPGLRLRFWERNDPHAWLEVRT